MAESHQPDLTQLTVQLLSAYVGKNDVAVEDLAGLIASTREALAGQTVAAEPEQPAHVPVVGIRKSLASPDHLLSMIDGKPYKTLKRHLASHGLTPADYRARYKLPNDYPMVAKAYSEARRAVAARVGLGNRLANNTPTADSTASATAPAQANPADAEPAPKKAAPAKPAAKKPAATKATVNEAAVNEGVKSNTVTDPAPAAVKAAKPAPRKKTAPAKATAMPPAIESETKAPAAKKAIGTPAQSTETTTQAAPPPKKTAKAPSKKRAAPDTKAGDGTEPSESKGPRKKLGVRTGEAKPD